MRATLICSLVLGIFSFTQVLFAGDAKSAATQAAHAEADAKPDSKQESKPESKQDAPSENRFGVQGGLLLGLGTMSNNSGTVPSRAMNVLALQALPGYRLGSWMPGLYLQYGLVGQSADPASVSNQNLGGAGYLIGLGTTYDCGKFNFLVDIHFLGSYTLSTQTFGGQTSVYSSPLGFTLMADYRVLNNYPDWLAGIFVQSTGFSTNTLGGSSVDVSGNKIFQTFYGLNASYHY